MMKLDIEFQDLDFDTDNFIWALDNEIREIMKEAARQFLKEVMRIVPIYSGESTSLFEYLADYLHVDLGIVPDPESKRDGTYTGYMKGRWSNSDRLPVRRRKDVWQFYYELPEDHYINVNEVLNANLYGFHLRKPGPYGAMLAGETAAEKYVNDQLDHMKLITKN